MLNRCLFDNGHLTDFAISLLAEGNSAGCNSSNLPNNEKLPLLAHLESCSECMERFLCAVSKTELEELPEGLEERIIERIKAEKPGSGRVQIVFVNIFKIGIGVSLAMLLFFSGAFQKMCSATENLIGYISAKNESYSKPAESTWDTLLADFKTGFSNFTGQLNSLFKGEIRNEQ